MINTPSALTCCVVIVIKLHHDRVTVVGEADGGGVVIGHRQRF